MSGVEGLEGRVSPSISLITGLHDFTNFSLFVSLLSHASFVLELMCVCVQKIRSDEYMLCYINSFFRGFKDK